MAIGFAAAMATAAAWAVASTLIASQASRVDAFTLSLVRFVWGAIFLFPATFVLGAEGDYARMSTVDIAALVGTGFLATGMAETLYAVTIPLLGLTRTFAISTGSTVIFAFVFGLIFIGDTLTWQVGVGSAVIILGVYLVTFYGRPQESRTPEPMVDAPPRRSWLGRLLTRKRPSIAGDSAVAPDAVPALTILGQRAVKRPSRLMAHSLIVGIIFAVALGVMWGGATVWLRSASAGFDAAPAASVRMPAVILFVLVVALVRPNSTLRRRALPLRSHAVLAVSGLIGTGLLTLLIVISLQRISSGEFAVLFSTAPLFGIVLATVFLRERATRWAVLGALVIVGGIALIV